MDAGIASGWSEFYVATVGAAAALVGLIMLTGGILVATSGPLGLAWVAVAIVLIFVTSMLNAWVLLVEVQR